jgi:hypothetical protein
MGELACVGCEWDMSESRQNVRIESLGRTTAQNAGVKWGWDIPEQLLRAFHCRVTTAACRLRFLPVYVVPMCCLCLACHALGSSEHFGGNMERVVTNQPLFQLSYAGSMSANVRFHEFTRLGRERPPTRRRRADIIVGPNTGLGLARPLCPHSASSTADAESVGHLWQAETSPILASWGDVVSRRSGFTPSGRTFACCPFLMWAGHIGPALRTTAEARP